MAESIKNTENKLKPEDIARVKGLGCLRDKRFDDIFNVRVITGNGKIGAEALKTLAEAAERFGSGEAALTSRMTVELQGVKYGDIEALREFLKEKGMETGGTGAKVRPVVSCKGTTCQYGLIDTFALSQRIHEEFYKGYHDTALPHKFKIAVGGCPNNCVKPDLNDVGVIGQLIPVLDGEKCRGCKVCQMVKCCPMKAAEIKDGKIAIDTEKCNNCGRCEGKCPFGVSAGYKRGFKLMIGGRWGKKFARGRALDTIFETEDEVIAAIKRALELFIAEGEKAERFSDTVSRLGFEYVQGKITGEKTV